MAEAIVMSPRSNRNAVVVVVGKRDEFVASVGTRRD
jgi:hypothetical protein